MVGPARLGRARARSRHNKLGFGLVPPSLSWGVQGGEAPLVSGAHVLGFTGHRGHKISPVPVSSVPKILFRHGTVSNNL